MVYLKSKLYTVLFVLITIKNSNSAIVSPDTTTTPSLINSQLHNGKKDWVEKLNKFSFNFSIKAVFNGNSEAVLNAIQAGGNVNSQGPAYTYFDPASPLIECK